MGADVRGHYSSKCRFHSRYGRGHADTGASALDIIERLPLILTCLVLLQWADSMIINNEQHDAAGMVALTFLLQLLETKLKGR